MAGQIDKLKPLKVYGRTHYACTRCKLSKVKCSGEKPACSNCKALNKGDACVYPSKDRKIVIMESDLKKLHQKIEYLERRELEQTDGSGVKSNEKSSERSELVERSGDTNGQTDYEYPSKTRYSVQNQLGEFGEIETLGSLDGPTNIPSSLPGGTPNFGVAMGQLGLGQFSGNPQGETTMEMVSMDGEREILGKIPRDMEVISFMVEEIISQVFLADFRDFHNILSQHHTLLRWM